MRAERRVQVTFILVAVVAVIVLFVVADSTLGLSPRACGLCHADQVRGGSTTAHAQVECLSCHLESGVWSLPGFKVQQWAKMYPAQLFGKPASPPTGVSRAACVSCHDVAQMAEVTERNGLRFSHRSCAPEPSKCSECHSASSHGKATRWALQVDMETCVVCHTENGGPVQCDACHEGRLQSDRLRRGTWRVTHGPQWQSTHSMGSSSSCSICHEQNHCVKCHSVPIPHPDSFGSTHGSWAQRPDAKCKMCHAAKSFCYDCHGIAMPHPASFLKSHAKVAKVEGNPLCLSCHDALACTACHARHRAHPNKVEMARFRAGQ